MMTIGSACLALGIALPWILPRSAVNPDAVDFARGMLLGISAPALVMATVKRRRDHHGEPGS